MVGRPSTTAGRQVTSIDPDGRLLTLSCGIALHHARTTLQAHGAHLPRDPVAVTIELADPAYRADLHAWTHRQPSSRDGISDDTIPPPTSRPAPIRDFTGSGPATLADPRARHAGLFTDADDPRDWLAAGEALSAVLLTATANGLATSVMSDLVEVDSARQTRRTMLANLGHPMIVIRIGYPRPDTPPPGGKHHRTPNPG